MHTFGRKARKFIKRHGELLCILALVCADLFLSGIPLLALTAAGVLCVIGPALAAMSKLDPAGQITYLKAFVKTPNCQRLAIVLFWLWGIRFFLASAADANLFAIPKGPSLTGTILAGLELFAPISSLFTPVIIYGGVCLLAVLARTQLKASKKDPDLVGQRQKWSLFTQVFLSVAFVTSIFSITANPHGPCYLVSNWLLASARDANLFRTPPDATTTLVEEIVPADNPLVPKTRQLTPPSYGTSDGVESRSSLSEERSKSANSDAFSDLASSAPAETDEFVPPSPGKSRDSELLEGPAPPTILDREAPVLPPVLFDDKMDFLKPFDTFVIGFCSLAIFVLLFEPISRFNAFLTSACWRVVSPKSLQNIIEAFLEALHLPKRELRFREPNPVWRNALRTLLWLIACYAALFWLFGISRGPLGTAIESWMMASAIDAGMGSPSDPPSWLFEPKFRMFVGAIVALYATAPIAVTAAVILPYAKARRITINSDGLLLARGPYFSLWGRQFRLWSDLKALSVRNLKARNGKPRFRFNLSFRSGGHLTFTSQQVSARDLRVLLDSIDEHAGLCAVAPEVFAVCEQLLEGERDIASSDGITHNSLVEVAKEEFKSTIFVPIANGELLPNRQTRVIRQLASKPLCAVYLAREECGRMVTVKQFYLAEENDETAALKKILEREYDLLSRLDHPGIAKVVDLFVDDKSTFLVIEHRLGTDLRTAVKEHGPRSEGLTISWAKQLCEIMIYLHGLDPPVLHRDLTPDNIIVGDDGRLRLIDFGAAREFLDGITGTMIGKHCYVAPEQLRGEATCRSDIYSFGGTLYFLLTGRDPIALSQSVPSKKMECTDELDELIRDCTEFDEGNRPSSFTEVLNRLETDQGAKIKVPAKKEEALV